MKNRKLSLVFLIFAICVLLVTLIFVIQALKYKPGKYTLAIVGYAGSFNRRAVNADKWPIEPYWVMHILGVAGMCLLSFFRRNNGKDIIKGWQAILTGILLAIFGYIGAKILFIIENYKTIKSIGLTFSGVSFFGTVFFMPLAIPAIKRMLFIRMKDLQFMDFCTPAGILMLAFIRIGCFMNGCCRGIVVDVNGKPLMCPVQLIECSFDFLLLSIILNDKIKKRFENGLYILFMMGYGLIRFVLEKYRNTSKFGNLFIEERGGDSRKTVLSNGQIFAVICMTIGIVYIMWHIKQSGKKNKQK
ncbi:Prolipoprotein diacylglyceryltransferase [Eubacterium ruminantium]|nr:Prolipoprotein diacylglyceryltransferase [Eubacterium ruminantium]